MRKLFLFALMLTATFGLQAQIYVYILDASGTATNVRNAPNGKVVQTIEVKEGCVVNLLAEKNGWWKIDPEVELYGDNEGVLNLTGSKSGYWLHHSVLSFTIAGDPTGCMRVKPSRKAKAVKLSDSTELQFRPIGMKGKWVKAKTTDGKYTGWIHSDKICYNPLTTCP